ncbi:ATP-binding cassette domain-containing protein [Rhizobium sp. CFBP 8752]|uniref:ATP-binding cassette domain-containing protein n=1 Tax=Rhizobium sp. CFBP 8752 TaxID=2775301 RepID=UPI001780F055|nr:ATP-binding cassette domain-containing protein [Rhizobium sp. CFBP 8752]MBD8665681.1 ATP-binding cassette domain-containing protein [Rhizobium sp. CFBP 8752]
MSNSTIPFLTLENVTKRFGLFKAINGVSEVFAPGELICVIGPNGAGKSTLLNMICGTLPVSEGRVLFGDEVINGLPPEKIANLGIARKFQVPSVFESLTVAENLTLAGGRGLNRDELDALIEKIHLTAERDIRGADLPHGGKQWLEMGMALAMKPKVLLLDEPTAGLSVDETSDTARFLKQLRGEATVIVIEHDMAFVRELNARTIVLHHGALIASGSFEDIESNEAVRDVYLGRH